MKKRTLICALVAVSCGGQPHHDLTVTSWSPKSAVDRAPDIEVRFDRPVVDDAAVGGPVDPTTVDIAPKIAWSGRWQDRQTIVVEPGADLAAGTKYTVKLAGDLARRTGDFSFSFVHQPLVLDGLIGADPNAIDPNAGLTLTFNHDVDPARVTASCSLDGPGGTVRLRASSDAATDTEVALTTSTALELDADYALTCNGLTAAGGDAPMDASAPFKLHTRAPLAITRLTPDGQDVSADEVPIIINLSSPVSLDAIRAAVAADPQIPGLGNGYLDASGKTYKVVADLDTDTEYTVTVADLVDLTGAKLAEPFTSSFHTGDASPRISMERGLYALEAAAKGYSVWTRNVTKYQVSCARIPKSKLVTLLTGAMNYDPWGGYDDSQEIDWKALGVDKTEATVDVGETKNKWHQDQLDLGKTCGAGAGARGVYLADVSSDEVAQDPNQYWGPRNNRVMIDVTDLGVMIKEGPASGLVWVTSLATGSPVAGAKVVVYDPQGKQVWVDVTDKDGIVKMPGSAKLLPDTHQDNGEDGGDEDGEEEYEYDWDSYRNQRLIATIEKDKDLAVVDGNWANGIQIWNFGVQEERRGSAKEIRGFLQSDRGLYRPGETVHFKGIAREIAAGRSPRVPSQKPVHVSVSDARGATAYDGDVSMSKFGGFSFDLPIDAEAPVGDWYVSAKVQDRVFRERFLVEEFKPATYEVKLSGGEKNVRLGERLDLGVDASYLFGAPVGDAAVQWSVSRRKHWLQFKGRDEYTFDDNGDSWWWYDDERDQYGELVSDGEGATDDKGHFGFTVRDPDPSLTGPYDYVISASVTDQADQTLSASKVVTAHQNDLYLGMHSEEFVQAAGMPFAINVIAVRPDGSQVASKAKMTLIRKQNDCTWSSVAGRDYASCTEHDQQVSQDDLEIPATGQLTQRIYPKDPGDYLIRLEAKDSRGNPVVTSSMVWVIGKGEAFWSGDESDRMTLIASKAKYQPGDTARIVAQANLVQPTALITIERDGILSAEVRKMDSAAEGVSLEIKDAWAPDVFASVAMVSGRHGDGDRNRPQFKMGVVELKVDSEQKHLKVEVALDEAKVRPGSPVSGHVTVTRDGKPVAAELSLSVADEGVLELIAYQTPDPMKTFYAAWGLGVDSGTNWNRLARISDPEAGDPDAGGDYAGSEGPKVRSRFLSSAYWNPKLVTDAKGMASFSFDAPDNLTAFRVMAVAADQTDGFGAGDTRLTIDKPLMATPVLPRFVDAGDHLSVGFLVHNHTAKDGTAKVSISSDGLSITDTTQEVAVKANGEARVRFAAVASENAAATLTMSASMNGEKDALKLTIPIRRPRVIDETTIAHDQADVSFAVDPGTLKDESEVDITVDRTGMGDLEPSLRYLVEYPYGCLEQTLSRFVPLAVAKDLVKQLGLASLDGTKADAFLKAGVAKVARHQQGDGNFSLWPQSQPYPHLTAYALWGLHEAQQAGVEVPQDTIDRGLASLQTWIDDPATITPDNQGATAAMAAYDLAEYGKPDQGAIERLYAVRAHLPRWGQAFLLRAMIASKSSEKLIASVEDELVSLVKVKDGVADVDDADNDAGSEHEFYFGSKTRSTALVLAALIDRNPDHPLIPALVAGLQQMRRADGRWDDTQDNLWSLVALTAYARHIAAGTGSVTITSGDQQLAKKKLVGAEVFVVRTKLSALTTDQLHIAADKGVHWTARLVQAKVDDGKAQSHGFTVEREYVDALGNVVDRVAAGDLVTVRLSLTVDADTPWVAMVDPLPAGLEAVNPALATAGGGAQITSTGGDWWEPTWDETEVRDDRVQWFADNMRAGAYTMTYQARATIDGTFAAPPATAEAMYAPDTRGRTASTTLTVTK